MDTEYVLTSGDILHSLFFISFCFTKGELIFPFFVFLNRNQG